MAEKLNRPAKLFLLSMAIIAATHLGAVWMSRNQIYNDIRPLCFYVLTETNRADTPIIRPFQKGEQTRTTARDICQRYAPAIADRHSRP